MLSEICGHLRRLAEIPEAAAEDDLLVQVQKLSGIAPDLGGIVGYKHGGNTLILVQLFYDVIKAFP